MISVIQHGETNWIDVFCDFLIKNQPCMLSSEFTDSWPARKLWVLPDGQPNYEYLRTKYGKCIVPALSADGCVYEEIGLEKYLDDMENCTHKAKLYLKDWHFQSTAMHKPVYDLPLFLRFDWINQECWTSDVSNPFGGDYRFVYIGAKGTWTKFHCDVMNTYSWSANICGRKLWYLMQPGKEKIFMKNGQLCEDIRDYKDRWKDANVIEFIQEPGQIVFVPSMWHHQVHNIEDAISINHNVINACNVDLIIELMRTRLVDVYREIEDVRSILSCEEFEEKCQLILNADIRINFSLFRRFLNMVIDERAIDAVKCWVCAQHTCIFECKKDDRCIERIRSCLKKSCKCDKYTALCENCDIFVKSFELTCAIHAKFLLDSDTYR